MPGAARGARHRRPAAELPRRARRLAGGAARLRALPLRAAPRRARRRARSSGSRSRSPSTTAPSRASRCTARTARAGRASASTRSPPRASSTRSDEREAALLRYLRALLEERGRPPMHLHEEAREAGWNDEQLLEAIAFVALETLHRDGQRRRRRAGRRLHRAGAPAARRLTPWRDVADRHREPRRRRPADAAGRLLPALPRGGRADRQALDRARSSRVLLDGGPLRFSEIAQAVPQLSDRLLSERMKELEARGIVERARRARGRRRASTYALTRRWAATSSRRSPSWRPGRSAGSADGRLATVADRHATS